MEIGLIPPALIILLAAVSGYFSLMETALIESHRGRLEKLSEDGDADAKAVLEMIENNLHGNFGGHVRNFIYPFARHDDRRIF